MTHKIQWQDHMTTAEYEALPLGTTIHTHGNGSYQKVGGWGRYDETLLLDVQTYELKSPCSVITFKEMTEVVE